MRNAREAMNAIFPLPPSMWSEWAKHEASLTTGKWVIVLWRTTSITPTQIVQTKMGKVFGVVKAYVAAKFPILDTKTQPYNGTISATNSKPRKTTIGIAEFGCSSGPNALLAVSHILETIYNNHRESGIVTPEILVFLNDLPGNDFNCLFKYVQSFRDELKGTKGDGLGPCFVAGIPGTFYGRLFPSDTLHIVHSSYSLNWLSQVPQGIQKTNEGNFYIAKSSPPSVITAYLNQFKKDFRVFLECRSDELVNGGRMVLTLVGRISSDPTSEDCCSFWELLALSARDMVLQGAIEEEKLNLFNILRAVSEPLMANHFGEEIMDKLYGRLRERITEYATKEKTEYTNLVISMTKVEKDVIRNTK